MFKTNQKNEFRKNRKAKRRNYFNRENIILITFQYSIKSDIMNKLNNGRLFYHCIGFNMLSTSKKIKKIIGRRFWIRPLLADRAISGAHQSLVLKVKEIDIQTIFAFLMKLMSMKKNAVGAPIPPGERLAIALTFLATGESQAKLSHYFKIKKAIVCGIAEEVCETIWKHTLKAVSTN